MMFQYDVKLCLFVWLCVGFASAWDSEQLEVFDVVEEVKENFYTLLNITQDASSQDIRRGFKILSLKLHPDKNLDEDTSVQFRNLVSVYEVLRSATKRKYYDEVLVKGLPNWRSAMYYYRYVRKVGLTEAVLILFLLVTVGQYLVNWAAYFEKKYTIEQNRKIKKKRSDKTESLLEIPKPSVLNLLPFQLIKLVYFLIISAPHLVCSLKTTISSQIEEATKAPPTPEPPEPPRVKTVRKRNKGFTLPEGPNFEHSLKSQNNNEENITATDTAQSTPPISGGFWSDDDLAELTRLVKKFPGGTVGRWEVIGEQMGRSVAEVTFMANKIKENAYKIAAAAASGEAEGGENSEVVKVKQKTKKSDLDVGDGVKKWSQQQQRALEEALARFPKGASERWERIADCVPNKTKEDCIMRFRYLAEVVKKQKETTE